MSLLIPQEETKATVVFKDWKNWAEPADIIDALNDVTSYMEKVFPNLKWAVSQIDAAIADIFDKRDQFMIRIFTNSADKEFESLQFRYIVETKELKPYYESYIIVRFRNLIYPTYFEYEKGNIHNEVYFAIYDEEDREDGTPLFQNISYEELSHIENIPSLLKLAGEYKGNGCLEVRVKDEDGEEDVWIYADNNGYKILTDPEPET